MKTFDLIVNQPTVKDGSLKTGLAVTKLANANLDVTLAGSVSVQGRELELGAVIAAALIPAYDNKFDTDLNQLLDLYAGGYVIAQQRNIAEILANGGQAKAKTLPLTAGSVLSAVEYLHNNLKLAELDQITLYSDINALLANDKSTKADMVQFLTSLRDNLLPTTLFEIYEEKLRKESELQAQFAELVAIGFDSIQPIADNRFSATLALINANALQDLTSKGYLLKDSNVDISTATIKVVFEKVEAKTE